jgi:hypothetical protein
MTVFYAKTYTVGGLYTHGGDRETHHDPMPEDLTRVWEIEPFLPADTRPWERDADGFWSMPDEPDSQVLDWVELLDGFGPVTDDEGDAGMGLEELAARNRRDQYAASLEHLAY